MPVCAPRVVTSGSGRPADAPLRGDLSSVTRRPVGVVRRPHVREPDRLAGDHGLRAGRCAARGRIRAGGEPVRRAACLPAGAPPVAAGRADGDRALRAGRHRRGAPRRRRSSRTGPSRRRVRGARRARRAVARHRRALAARRGLLGRGACAHAGARQGARRRLPDRHPRPAAGRGPPRRHGDRDAYGRRLRTGPRDAPPLALHRPRAALPVADARLGPARRRRRRRSPASARARPARPRSTTRTTTTITSTTRTGITITGTTIRRSNGAASWASGSPRGSCRARRRSSSC